MNKHKKISLSILIATAVALYFLAGISFNPLILWTSLPLYLSYLFVASASKSHSIQRLFSAYGFMLFGIAFSLFYHLTWYFDWQGTKTGSSTSALIFIWLPMYAVILGFVGYMLGHVVGKLYERKA